MIRDERLTTGAVALVGLIYWLGLPRSVAQMHVHLSTHGAFDDRFVECQHQVFLAEHQAGVDERRGRLTNLKCRM